MQKWGVKLKEHCKTCAERTEQCERKLCEEKEKEFNELFSERLDRGWFEIAERTGMLKELKNGLKDLG